MEKIVSASNPKIKKVMKLHTARGRQQQQRIIIFGLRETKKAFQAGVSVEELFVCLDDIDESIKSLFGPWQKTGARVFELPRNLFDKIAYGNRTDNVIAVAHRPVRSWASLAETVDANVVSLVVVLQAIEKPGNLGAVFRTADAAGVDAVFIADAITDVFHPNTIRSSMGTVFLIPAVIADSDEILAWLRQYQFQILPAVVDATCTYTEVDLTRKSAIVLGSEANGLDQRWHAEDFQPIKINMAGAGDSLNVSVAAAIILFEAARQRSV